MNLEGATAIITGGAVRIGRAIATALAQSGVNICVHYGQSEQEAQEAVAEFRNYGVNAICVRADLNSPIEAAQTIFKGCRELGAANILINSAAIFESGRLATTDEANWDRHFNINLKSPFFLTQAFAKQLGSNDGVAINIVDWRGVHPVPGQAAYTIAKAGLVAQTKLLAQELGPNIRVNAIAPGAILPAPGEAQDVFEMKSALNPLGRIGNVQYIADATMYLLKADFVTGEVLQVTGGQQLRCGNVVR